MVPTITALVADLELLCLEPDCPASRLGALSQLRIAQPEGTSAPEASRPDMQTQAARGAIERALDRLGSSRVGRAVRHLVTFVEDPEPLGTREAKAAEALGESQRTVQRNRGQLLAHVAEQLLYMELEALNARLEDVEPLALGNPVGWDGFFMEHVSATWSMRWDGTELVHVFDQHFELVSGGIGSFTLPLAFLWTGSGPSAVEPLPRTTPYVHLGPFANSQFAPDLQRHEWDLFYFGRALQRNERMNVDFQQVGRDPEVQMTPILAWTARTDNSRITHEIQLPEDCPIQTAEAIETEGLGLRRQPCGEPEIVTRDAHGYLRYEWPPYAVRQDHHYILEVDSTALHAYARSRQP